MHEHLLGILDEHYARRAVGNGFTDNWGHRTMPNLALGRLQHSCESVYFKFPLDYEAGGAI